MGNRIDGGTLRRAAASIEVDQLLALSILGQGTARCHHVGQFSAAAPQGSEGIALVRIDEYAAADLNPNGTALSRHKVGVGAAFNLQAAGKAAGNIDRRTDTVHAAGIVAGAILQGHIRCTGNPKHGFCAGSGAGKGMTLPVNCDRAALEFGYEVVVGQHLVLQEGQQRVGLTIGRGGGIGEGIVTGGRPIHGQRDRLLVAAFRAQAGGLTDILMTAFLAAVGASLDCRQAVRVGTFDDLHLGGAVHVPRLHQAGAGLVGIAIGQQSRVVPAAGSGEADAVKAAAGQLNRAIAIAQLQSGGGAAGHGQVALHIDTAVKGATFHLGMTVLNVEGVLLGGISVTASDEGDVIHSQTRAGIQLAHRHRRAGLGGAGILHGAVPDGHILCQYPQHRRVIGIAGQGVAAQIQGHGFVNLHGFASLVEVAPEGDGVAVLGGGQGIFQAGVPDFADGVRLDQRLAEGAVAVRIHLANVVTGAAALALTVHILACVRHHLDFAAEIFRNGGIHNAALGILIGEALVQKSQRLLVVPQIDAVLEGAAPQMDGLIVVVEGNGILEDRIPLDGDLQEIVVRGLEAAAAKGHAVQNQLAFRVAVNALIQRAAFQGESAVGEVVHFQLCQGMALQIQDRVLVVFRGVARVKASMDHVLRKEKSSASYQMAAHLRRVSGLIRHDGKVAVLVHQQRIRRVEFPALQAFAVDMIDALIVAGVDRQGDGIGVHAVAADGQGAVDLGGKQPGLVGHRGQLVIRIKILQREGRLVEALQHGVILQLPLVGDGVGQAGGQGASYRDFIVSLPGIQIPVLAADGGILGLGGDGDGRTENGDGDFLGEHYLVAVGGSAGENHGVGSLLHGFIRRDRQDFVRKESAGFQSGVGTFPVGGHSIPVQVLVGNGKGGLLVGNALIEVALLSLHREHGAGDFADVESLLLGVIVDIVDIAGIHFRFLRVSLVGSQNGQIAGIARTPEDCRVDAVSTAGGVDGAAVRVQVGTGKTGAYAAVGLQAAALQIHGIKGYGVMRAAAGLNGTTLKDQGSGTGCTARVGAVKDGTVALKLFAPAVADDLKGTGTLDGQRAVVQIQRRVALDLVVAHKGQGGVPGELDGLGEGLVIPVHLAGDGFLLRQGGHLAVYPAEQGFQLLHAGDLRLLGLAQGFKSGVRRFQRVQVAFGHIIHVGQGIDHGLHRRHGLVLPGGSSLLGGLRLLLRRLRFLLRGLGFLLRRLCGGVRLLTGVGILHHPHRLGRIRRLLRPGRGGQHPDTEGQG